MIYYGLNTYWSVYTNDELVDYLKESGTLTHAALERAMRRIDRALFCSERPYEDNAQPIGHGSTISQPSTIVVMTQALDVKKGDRILEVGSGSGYQSALLWAMGCEVVSVELNEDVLEIAEINLEKVKAEVKTILGDGSCGYENDAPYDAIIVTAGAPDVPQPLIDQLKVGGRLVIPVGNRLQTMKVITKKKNDLEIESLGSFVFVPLLGKHGF